MQAGSCKEGVRQKDTVWGFPISIHLSHLTFPFLLSVHGSCTVTQLPGESWVQCDSVHKQNTGKACGDKYSSYKPTPNSQVKVCWRMTTSWTWTALSSSLQIVGIHLWQCSFRCTQRKQMLLLSNNTSVLFISHNPRNPAWNQTNLT